jgi:glycosyltransferase involved in cell wall biosynthesis
MRVLYATIAALRSLGHEVALTCPGEKAAGLEEFLAEMRGQVGLLPWPVSVLGPRDLWLVPESWPNALAPGIQAGARTVVYAQSWNLMLSGLPPGVRWNVFPVIFMAVSRPVAWFMRTLLDLPVSFLLPPSVDPLFFRAGQAAKDSRTETPRRRGGAIRVAWMPRKNRALADIIRHAALACLEGKGPSVEWISLHNLPLAEVARIMATCHVFLSTAFPEGFGLPPLEAMAAGCIPVGFTGFGGWEYMRQAVLPEDYRRPAWDRVPGGYEPAFVLEEKPWGGNGVYVADGDVIGASLALASLVRLARDGGESWDRLLDNAAATAAQYSEQNRRALLADLWPRLCAP